MTSLDDFGKDFVALVRAGCSVRFDPVGSAFGVLYVRVVVMPNVSVETRSASSEFRSVVKGARASVPIVGQFSLLEPGKALTEFFADARLMLLGMPPD